MVRIGEKNVSTFIPVIPQVAGKRAGLKSGYEKPATACGLMRLANHQDGTFGMAYDRCGVGAQQIRGDVRAVRSNNHHVCR